MIELDDNSEFTVTVANLIKTLSELDWFDLEIWAGSELPYLFTEDDDYLFLQESVRIITDSTIVYIYYDMITGMRIVYDDNKRMVEGYF